MTPYTIFNAMLGGVLVPLSCWLLGGRWREIRIAARVAFLMVILAYPWDFFGVQLNVWNYPRNPGTKLYGVPINDSVLIWICTFLTSSVLLFIRKGQPGR
jgi:lycopene cyclase domain-containing protein